VASFSLHSLLILVTRILSTNGTPEVPASPGGVGLGASGSDGVTISKLGSIDFDVKGT
jgi:hypothetical protein